MPLADPNDPLEILYQSLPNKPYCTDDLGFLSIRRKDTAVRKRYIQHNPPSMVHSLVFDIDHPTAVLSWADENLPPPTWSSQNPQNGHAHIGYLLKTPVCTSDKASRKAIKYLDVIRYGFAEKLQADMGYSGLITKNPYHQDWRTEIWTYERYELDYLADFINVDKLPPQPKLSGLSEKACLGRNCYTFYNVSKWAYSAVREHRGGSWYVWLDSVLKECLELNMTHTEPLPFSEVKGIANSIAKFCWKNDPYHYKNFLAHYDDFVARQAVRGAKGGKVSKRKPVPTSEATTKPWEAMGISRATYYNRKKQGKI